MENKKNQFRFSILFDENMESHVSAAKVLNNLPKKGKSDYISEAIKFYENQDNYISKDFFIELLDKIVEEKLKNYNLKLVFEKHTTLNQTDIAQNDDLNNIDNLEGKSKNLDGKDLKDISNSLENFF